MKSLAFVFPGQGSQTIGMLADLAAEFPLVESTYAECSSILGYDLWRLVQNGPEAELNTTQKTQPALLAASIALWRIWNEMGGAKPRIMAGHSLGEYSALVCAGAIHFSDAVPLVANRGVCMQSAVAKGAGSMAVILGLADDRIEAICKEAAQGEIVSPANFNCPGQVVISGHKMAVARALTLAARAGAKRSSILPVSVPSHCLLMREAAEHFSDYLDKLKVRSPDIPVLHNIDNSCRINIDEIKQALQAQLYQAVRWADTIQEMLQVGVNTIIECGPSKVLIGLSKRVERRLTLLPISTPESLHQALLATRA